jgi:septal ring factor EnvC (AmiA/AmiB activator)
MREGLVRGTPMVDRSRSSGVSKVAACACTVCTPFWLEHKYLPAARFHVSLLSACGLRGLAPPSFFVDVPQAQIEARASLKQSIEHVENEINEKDRALQDIEQKLGEAEASLEAVVGSAKRKLEQLDAAEKGAFWKLCVILGDR